MANNYTASSSFLPIPADKLDQAQEIVLRVVSEDSEFDFEYRFAAEGVGFSNTECFEPEHVERVVRILVDELELDEPFYCSWAYYCDKPRVGEFGGGAFVIVRGQDTYWVDATQHVMDHMGR